MSESFRIEELVAALEAARKRPEDDPAALSVRELTELTGMGPMAVNRLIRSLMTAGRVVCVRKPWKRIDGARTTIPAYKLVGGGDGDGGGTD